MKNIENNYKHANAQGFSLLIISLSNETKVGGSLRKLETDHSNKRQTPITLSKNNLASASSNQGKMKRKHQMMVLYTSMSRINLPKITVLYTACCLTSALRLEPCCATNVKNTRIYNTMCDQLRIKSQNLST